MLLVSERTRLPVQEAKAGNADAWNALFKRYQLPLYVYVFEMVGDEQTSLDIVQETFIKAARHIGSLQDNEKFGSWLFGIANQRCIQQWRNGKKKHDFPSEELTESLVDEESPDDLLIRREEEARFMELMNQLPSAQRSVLLLHFVEDFSLEEIAQITGTLVGTVKSRIHYAKKALRALIEENHNENATRTFV